MTGRDPDEPDRPPKDHETDVDTAFAEIVAGWEREHGPAQWPAEPDTEPVDPVDAAYDGPETGPVVIEIDPVDDEGHFVPPEPPPIPRPQPQTIGAGVLFALGLALLLIPDVLGFTARAGLILGLLAITGSIGWLFARLRKGPPTDSGWDDGAQL